MPTNGTTSMAVDMDVRDLIMETKDTERLPTANDALRFLLDLPRLRERLEEARVAEWTRRTAWPMRHMVVDEKVIIPRERDGKQLDVDKLVNAIASLRRRKGMRFYVRGHADGVEVIRTK